MDTNYNRQNNNHTPLPLRALSEIPEAKNDAKQITALVKDSGKVTGYQLSDGSIIDKQTGVRLAKQGDIKDVAVAANSGTEYLKSIPDDTENNNLGNLPSISSNTVNKTL